MQKGDYLAAILRSVKTVFTSKDAALLWQESDSNTIKGKLNYYVKKGDLIRIRRGIYAKSGNYNKLELATRILTPSYISFETILAKEGVIFQYHNQITVASYIRRKISIGGQAYSFNKLKNTILTNTAGIENQNEISLAVKERALLDTLYINTDYHFDNLRSIDWNLVKRILPIYTNKRLNRKIHKLWP